MTLECVAKSEMPPKVCAVKPDIRFAALPNEVPAVSVDLWKRLVVNADIAYICVRAEGWAD